MKLLLVGPYPPPHGGISVHVAGLRKRAHALDVPCRVINTDRQAPESSEYICVRSVPGFLMTLVRHALQGWTIHVHTNGHNLKSWLIVLAGGLAGSLGPDAEVTLHSGMVPDYLENASWWRRRLASLACRLYPAITCVNPRIQNAVLRLGIRPRSIHVEEAFLGAQPVDTRLDETTTEWFARHRPVLAVTGTDGPEYGIDLLLNAVDRLAIQQPGVGCVLIGKFGRERRTSLTGLAGLAGRDGLAGCVLTTGDIPHEQCLTVISISDVFVRPTFADGDSISVREALALGVPVVASDCVTRPGNTTLFQTGNAEDLIAKLKCVLQESLKNCVR